MAKPDTRNSETVRSERPLNEARVLGYQRLMRADVRLEQLRSLREPSPPTLADYIEPGQLEQEDDLYFATLARYVARLGGRLEVQAIFPETTITVLTVPDREDD